MSETIVVIGLISLSAVYLGFRLRGLFLKGKPGRGVDTGSSCSRSCGGCESPCEERSGLQLHKIEIVLLLLLPLFSIGCFESGNTPYYDPLPIEGDPDLLPGLTNFLILDEKEFDEVALHGYVFINFTTNWCGICKEMAPALESLAKKNSDRILFVKVDGGEMNKPKNEALQARFGVRGYPHYVLLHNGKVIFEHIGGFSEPDMQFKLEMALIDNDAKLIPPSGMVIIPGGPDGGKLVPIDEINPEDFILPEETEELEEPENSPENM